MQLGDLAVIRKYQPRDRLRKVIQTLIQVRRGIGRRRSEAFSEFVRLASTLMLQVGLEAEQEDFVGRPHYQCVEGNGYRSENKLGSFDSLLDRLFIPWPQHRGAFGDGRGPADE